MIDFEEFIIKKKAPRSKAGRRYSEKGYSLLAEVIEKEGFS
jgi:hypothetical protein